MAHKINITPMVLLNVRRVSYLKSKTEQAFCIELTKK